MSDVNLGLICAIQFQLKDATWIEFKEKMSIFTSYGPWKTMYFRMFH